MFGIVVGAVFFGKPEIMLLLGIGAAIPDLDREYAFLSKESFSRRQVHRAFCHNLLFLGAVYLINPYLGIGAFSHSLLDALTTARDRGVEWLYPFTRLVHKAVYDYDGKRMELDPKHKIYLLQNELPVLTKLTTKDLQPGAQTKPWRRTYGPALSGRLFDQGVFVGSIGITLLLIFFSALGFRQFIDLTPRINLSFVLPVAIGASGVIINFVGGEIDRKKLAKNFKPEKFYMGLFYLSVGMIIFALILGGIMNLEVVYSTASQIPYIAAGVALVALISLTMLRIRASKPLPTDPTKEPVIV